MTPWEAIAMIGMLVGVAWLLYLVISPVYGGRVIE